MFDNQLRENIVMDVENPVVLVCRDLECVCDCEVASIAMLLVDTAGCNLPELRLPEEVSKGNEGQT